ncbi:MAG: entericidin A/B family lipoprotein [Sphingomonas sp.]|nr:entericidin A/B family lipoprotein [Sphingomonas sp.]
MRTIALLMGAVMILTACNTVRGIGRDVESVGRTVSDTAD